VVAGRKAARYPWMIRWRVMKRVFILPILIQYDMLLQSNRRKEIAIMFVRSCTYLAVIVILLTGCSYVTQGPVNESRQAIAVADDYFGDAVDEIVYPDQNWDRWDSLWFYNTSQGSDLMPLDIFLELEQASNNEKFRDNKNMLRFRYLTQEPSWDNEYGLPVGWVKDTYKDKYDDTGENIDYVGFTCAACHTTQINYSMNDKKRGIRIDGGPAMADMETMLDELEAALKASLADQNKFDRLVSGVTGRSDEQAKGHFRKRLDLVYQDIKRYNSMNNPILAGGDGVVTYGYARLDAFGRIFNRVLEHIAPPGEFHYYPRSTGASTDEFQFRPNPANAPVSYPFLWDTPQHDFVQWNGVGDNGSSFGLGPLGRNTGEVIGVFATFEVKPKEANFWRKLWGQDAKKGSYSYPSSVKTRNLVRLERTIKDLWSPSWEQLAEKGYLPRIKDDTMAKGRKHFEEYLCGACHQEIDRKTHAPTDTDEPQMVIAQFSSLDRIETDPKMAANAIAYCGQSGVLVDAELGDCASLDDPLQASVLAELTNVTQGVLMEGILRSTRDTFEVIREFFTDTILFRNPVNKHGTSRQVDLETGNKQYLNAYKGRPLNGIWATAPYLHNGSVPNLYELFLPSECSGDHSLEGETCRSERFKVGNRTLDTEKVGFVKSGDPGLFEFNTAIEGNSNVGHEYAAGVTEVPVLDENGNPERDVNGKIKWEKKPALKGKKIMELVEYLKTL
jgi:hypothetical protein